VVIPLSKAVIPLNKAATPLSKEHGTPHSKLDILLKVIPPHREVILHRDTPGSQVILLNKQGTPVSLPPSLLYMCSLGSSSPRLHMDSLGQSPATQVLTQMLSVKQ